MSANAESESHGGRYLGGRKGLLASLEVPAEMSRQLQERRARGREFHTFGDATEKLPVPNDMRVNGVISRLVLEDVRE